MENIIDTNTKIVFEKYGWIIFFTPVLVYAADKVTDVISKAIDNEYNLNIDFKNGQFSLTK